MTDLTVARRHYYPWLAVIVFVFLAGCGEGISKEEFETIQADLKAARLEVQSLEADKEKLRTTASKRALEELWQALSIDDIMVFPPSIVELRPTTASIQMITNVPVTCSIIHGLTTDYGEISTDDSMAPGGHTDPLPCSKGAGA